MKKYLIKIESSAGAVVRIINAGENFAVQYIPGDVRFAQIVKTYKTIGGASRFIEKVDHAWNYDRRVDVFAEYATM